MGLTRVHYDLGALPGVDLRQLREAEVIADAHAQGPMHGVNQGASGAGRQSFRLPERDFAGDVDVEQMHLRVAAGGFGSSRVLGSRVYGQGVAGDACRCGPSLEEGENDWSAVRVSGSVFSDSRLLPVKRSVIGLLSKSVCLRLKAMTSSETVHQIQDDHTHEMMFEPYTLSAMRTSSSHAESTRESVHVQAYLNAHTHDQPQC